MIVINRVDTSNIDFVTLVAKLDADLAIRDGDDHAFYDQFNKLDSIRYAVIAKKSTASKGCGAIKEFDSNTMEVKRMYVSEDARGQGVATLILQELENWARELGYSRCVLETGIRQPEAISLYKKNNYVQVNNYGQYMGVDTSICFEKLL